MLEDQHQRVRSLEAQQVIARVLRTQLTREGDRQLSVPSEAWSQLLYYRREEPATQTREDLVVLLDVPGRIARVLLENAPDEAADATVDEVRFSGSHRAEEPPTTALDLDEVRQLRIDRGTGSSS